MKFWLACFVMLFAGAEILQWIAQISGSAQLSGAWLVLGGMGLAAASNAKHLPKLNRSQSSGANAEITSANAEGPAETVTLSSEPLPLKRNEPISVEKRVAANAIPQTLDKATPAQTLPPTANSPEANPPNVKKTSDQDTISFKVRLPWF